MKLLKKVLKDFIQIFVFYVIDEVVEILQGSLNFYWTFFRCVRSISGYGFWITLTEVLAVTFIILDQVKNRNLNF